MGSSRIGKLAAFAVIFLAVQSRADAAWNPGVLGVPWANDFLSIAANEINVKTDARLAVHAVGNGTTDDTAALKGAIALAVSSGGGTVYLPAGDYKILAPSNAVQGSPLQIPSRVILRGDGPQSSRLFLNDPNAAAETDYILFWGGINFPNSSYAGMTDLGIIAVNPSTSPSAVLWNRGSKGVRDLFFNNLDIHLNNGKNFWMDGTDNLLVRGCTIDTTSPTHGPIYFTGDNHVTFVDNTLTYNWGRVQMQNNTNLLIQNNTFTRDAQNKSLNAGTAIESGGVEFSFGNSVQILNNTFKTLNIPPEETGDGEAIMTQHSTINDLQDMGSITGITAGTLTDANAHWGPITAGYIANLPGHAVAIVSGRAVGEWRTVVGINTANKTLILDRPWDIVPETGSLYAINRWTIQHATIQGNTLINNPNGIVLWDGCFDCTVENNTLEDSRGIILRMVDVLPVGQPEARRVHEVAFQTIIRNNTISNLLGLRPAFITLDAEAFSPDAFHGLGIKDVQVSGNRLNFFPANPSQSYGGLEISQEGLFPCFYFGPAPVQDPVKTVFQNISVWDNTLSTPVTYAPYFKQYATSTECATLSAPVVTTPATPAAAVVRPRIYPNPWRVDHHNGKNITFDQLPANSTVKIFTTSGHWVRTLVGSASNLSWDLKTDDGKRAASGLYLFQITGEGQKSNGKFAIIR